MVRITTNGTLYNYRSNLMQTTNTLNGAMTKVMTKRSFSSYASNPASATRAFKVHSSLNATRAQYANNQTVTSKFETAWSTMEKVLDDLTNELGKVSALEGLNGTNRDDLDTEAQVLRAGAESIIQSMNAKYNNSFIFAGSDNLEAPFDIDDEGFVTYRGVQIDNPDTLKNDYLADPDDPTSTVINPDTGNPYTNQEMLDKWAKDDPLYVDIGLGFELDANGEVIDSTAFDSAISGINILGYGLDENGNPKNLASIMLRLADVFESYDGTSGDAATALEKKAEELTDALNASQEAAIDAHADLDAQAKFLNSNGTQLEETFDALDTERSSIEDVDLADAVMELSWAQLCYNAALQVGANVIPQSLMDYLK